MRKEMIQLNGELYETRISYKKIVLNLTVTRGMIQNVIEKSGVRQWKITEIGYSTLSNKQRHCYLMSYEASPFFLQTIMDRLEIGHIDNTNIDYYRSSLEISRFKLPCQLQWQKGKGWKIIRRNKIYDNYGGKYIKEYGIHRYNLNGVKI